MIVKRKPKIGILGIMQKLYDKTYPNIVETQSNYVKEVINELKDVADFKFTKPARDRKDLEEIIEDYNNDKELDGIMIMMLTYSPGQRIVPTLKKNNLPIMLANIQPLPSVTQEWNMEHLTYNQGIHGAQDNMNAIVRLGINCPVVTGNWKEEEFKNFVKDWALAAQAAKALKEPESQLLEECREWGILLLIHQHYLKSLELKWLMKAWVRSTLILKK